MVKIKLYTNEEKLKIVHQDSQPGNNISIVAHGQNLLISTVQGWCKIKDELEKICSEKIMSFKLHVRYAYVNSDRELSLSLEREREHPSLPLSTSRASLSLSLSLSLLSLERERRRERRENTRHHDPTTY